MQVPPKRSGLNFADAHQERGRVHRPTARAPHERLLHGRAACLEPVDHPVIRPSINAMAETFRLATERPELGTVHSDDQRSGRSTASCTCQSHPGELVAKHEMQRELGRRTGTCFQRCVGLDAIGTCHSVTFDIDAKNGTEYHKRFLIFRARAGGQCRDRRRDDRSRRATAPRRRTNRAIIDLFLHVVKRDDKGIYVSGAKMHQTGAVNSHWLIFHADHAHDRRPIATGRWSGRCASMRRASTYVVGRQTNDTRIMDGGAMDAGNAQFAGSGIADCVRRRVRAARARVHGRRMGICVVAGRALYHLSSLVLRLQNRARRRR